jgi:tripartite-type tricarboxylate transporter receptor subunit TctC
VDNPPCATNPNKWQVIGAMPVNTEEQNMRKLIHAAAGAVAALSMIAAAMPAHAQAYPSKPVRLVLPFPPGGGTDILGRMLAQKLGDNLGQTVVAENRPGAGGNVGAEYASRQAPDGYTIVLCSPSIAISPSLYRKLNYDPAKDLTPISLVASIPNLLVVHPSVPVKSLKDIVALARKNPGKLNFGSGGPGTTNDLGARFFISENKLKIEMIPHKGASQAQIALLSGEVDMLVIGTAAAAPYVKAGKLRALAALGERRDPSVSDVPTVAESGMPWFTVDTWYGVLAPTGTPRDIINRLNGAFVKMLADPAMRKQLASRGTDAKTSTPEEFARFIKSETERWGKVVQASGARVD